MDNIHKLTLSKNQTCQMLGVSESLFDKKRDGWEKDHGFPTRLPGMTRWSHAAIVKWIETNGQTYAPAPASEAATNEAAILEANYGGEVA